MKPRENLVRLKEFQVADRRRQLSQLDLMIAEFDRMAAELDAQIASEERKAGITDTGHFAYPTFAKAARLRRDNLQNSRNDLLAQKAGLTGLLEEAEAELAKAQAMDARDTRQRDLPAMGRRAMIG